MSDLCLYQLADNFWGELGESDDHLVPQPENKHGNISSEENDSRRKLQSEVVESNADTSSKFRVEGKGTKQKQPVSDNGEMLKEGTWSHIPDGGFSSCDTEPTKGAHTVETGVTRICNQSFENGNLESDQCEFGADDSIMGDGCNADDNSMYPYPLGQMSQSDNGLSFLDSQQEDKDNGDLLFYGWSDIGNFDDVDRMFKNCDSTFGMQSVNNEEDMCWFSSPNATGRTEDVLKSGFQASGQKEVSSKYSSDPHEASQSDNEGHHIDAFNKNYVSDSKKMSSQNKIYEDTAAPVQFAFLHERYTKSENGDTLPPNEQLISGKRKLNHYNGLEEGRNQYLENDIQQHKQSGGPDSLSYMHMDYSNQLDQMSMRPTVSGRKPENNGCPSPSLKETSYASNQLQSMESSHGLSVETSALTKNETGENQDSSQGFQSPYARSSNNSTVENKMIFTGATLNQNQVQHQRNQIEVQNDFKGGNIECRVETDSSNIQDSSSCMSTVMDDISLEATSFRHLHQVMEKLDVRTKISIRDSLYRLARSAEQRHNSADHRGDSENGAGFMVIETDTNPIDRSIAHLLFHRPSDPSRVPKIDQLSLRPHIMTHESISRPQVLAEKQICPEEISARGENEMLISDDG